MSAGVLALLAIGGWLCLCASMWLIATVLKSRRPIEPRDDAVGDFPNLSSFRFHNEGVPRE